MESAVAVLPQFAAFNFEVFLRFPHLLSPTSYIILQVRRQLAD